MVERAGLGGSSAGRGGDGLVEMVWGDGLEEGWSSGLMVINAREFES
jgi:hypothetical protein